MKFRNYFYSILCGLVVSAALFSCSDDEENNNSATTPINIEEVATRGFVLNEGSYQLDNAHLNFFNYATDVMYANDLYYSQNGKYLGDTGQDVIAYDGNLFVAMYGSEYIVKLNNVGKEVARFSFKDNEELGAPRYLAGSNGYIYATTSGGYVAKIKASDMSYVGSVQVGKNPEQIIEEDGSLYCVNSGYGYDNRLSIINEQSFTCDNVEIMKNPQAIVASDGYIVIQGYGGANPDYTYPVTIYDKTTKKSTEIGKGTNIAAKDGILYVVNTTTDYSTTPYSGTTEVYSYNLKTGTKKNNILNKMPAELKNGCTYGISINDKTGHIYIMGTNYKWGDGVVYHFDNNGNYLGSFYSGGQNPKKVVFID